MSTISNSYVKGWEFGIPSCMVCLVMGWCMKEEEREFIFHKSVSVSVNANVPIISSYL